MIDTIVLTLDDNSFRIVAHDRFSPSTEVLYSLKNLTKLNILGGRSNIKCVQNPTTTELRAGKYKPRLTVTKRIGRNRQYQIALRVEFSIPKLLYGNNFDELEDEDFSLVISKLKQSLRDMGVIVSEPVLVNAPVSAIHFSKNIPLVDYTTPYTYLERLSRINLNQRLDLNQTDFRNEGHSLKFRANSFEVAFYDKMKDLDKVKISEKRAEENENASQIKLFEKLEISKPFEVLRMEVRLNRRQKLRQVLTKVGIEIEPTVHALFRREIAQKVLLYYMSEIERSYPPILLYDYKDAKTFLSNLLISNGKTGKTGLRKALQMLGARVIIEEVGIREFREITKKHGRANWYRFNKEMVTMGGVPEQQPFATIRQCLKEFKPLKLIDFQNKQCTIE
ncbi:MAG: hypothetical protein PVJ61_06250 [Dehalococcoidia bacterium]|jgi:hypothetical protein